MDYNQFSYYRANPYANFGYMPPRAHVNRHKPNFLTQLPMGQQHLNKIGKKQFSGNVHRSNIQSESLLKSPERYPYENRIALDKQYQRNLNTIDIEGASGGTLMSQAVRNKMKARQEIIRRQQQSNINSKIQPIINAQTFQQQKRRRIALQQYIKDQQSKQISDKQKSQLKKHEQNSEQANPHHSSNNKDQHKLQNQYYINNKKSRINNDSNYNIPRYQSIDVGRLQQNQRQLSYQQNYRNVPQYQHKHKNSDVSTSRYDSKQRQEDKNRFSTAESGKELHYAQFAQDRKSLRQQNPTYLSSQGSTLYMAAKNIIKGQ